MFNFIIVEQKYWEHEITENLKFPNEQKTLDGYSVDLKTLKNNYLKQVELPIWEKKMRNRKIFLALTIPSFLLLFTYRKVERIIDYLEYGL